MIDTHSHYDFAAFDDCREQLFTELASQGISDVILPGVSPDHWQKQLAVAAQFQCPYGLGIHPWYLPEDIPSAIASLCKIVDEKITDKKLVAIGECGLDKLRSEYDKQLILMDKHILLAQDYQLPLILHCVKAHEDMLARLTRAKPQCSGVVHGFYGSPELAKRYTALGFKLGIGEIVLNNAAVKLQKTVAEIPLTHFVVETDSTEIKPQNKSSILQQAQKVMQITLRISQLQNIPTVYVKEQLKANTLQLFEV